MTGRFFQDALADQPAELLVRRAASQRCLQIHRFPIVETRFQKSVGRQADPVAGIAELAVYRVDEADTAPESGNCNIGGRAVAPGIVTV